MRPSQHVDGCNDGKVTVEVHIRLNWSTIYLSSPDLGIGCCVCTTWPDDSPPSCSLPRLIADETNDCSVVCKLNEEV